MIGYLDLESADGAVRFYGDGQPDRIVQKVQGLPGLGFAAPRDSTYAAPGRHGSVTRTRYLAAALVTIEGVVRGSDTAEAYAHLDALSQALTDALDTPRLLKWRRGVDGAELQAAARLAGPLTTESVATRIVRYQASVRLDDPRGYGQTLLTSIGGGLTTTGGDTFTDTFSDTFDPGTGGTAAVTNSGTVATPPTFRIYGLAVDPQIVLVETGERIALSGTIAAGDFVEVDVARRTARLNGAGFVQGMIVSATTRWFELRRGASSLRLLAAANDAGAHLEIDYRPAWA